jgi:hypothetical protein
MARIKETEMRIVDGGKLIEVDDAQIAKWRNFSGENGINKKETKRSFLWLIDDEDIANDLKELGYTNVKEREGDDGEPYWMLEIKLKFNESTGAGPAVYLVTRGRKHRLNADTIGDLDRAYIERIDFDFAPNVYENHQTAWLRGARVIQKSYGTRFDEDEYEYDEEEDDIY